MLHLGSPASSRRISVAIRAAPRASPLWRVGALTLIGGILGVAPLVGAQEIMQAQVLDLTTLEVQVFVAGANEGDQVQCLLRDAQGRIRVGGTQWVSTGHASGSITLLSITLPVLRADEAEFAVAIVRGDAILRRTEWRPLFRAPLPRRAPAN